MALAAHLRPPCEHRDASRMTVDSRALSCHATHMYEAYRVNAPCPQEDRANNFVTFGAPDQRAKPWARPNLGCVQTLAAAKPWLRPYRGFGKVQAVLYTLIGGHGCLYDFELLFLFLSLLTSGK